MGCVICLRKFIFEIFFTKIWLSQPLKLKTIYFMDELHTDKQKPFFPLFSLYEGILKFILNQVTRHYYIYFNKKKLPTTNFWAVIQALKKLFLNWYGKIKIKCVAFQLYTDLCMWCCTESYYFYRIFLLILISLKSNKDGFSNINLLTDRWS